LRTGNPLLRYISPPVSASKRALGAKAGGRGKHRVECLSPSRRD